MTYQELLKWAAARGKTEQDVLHYHALADVEGLREMSDHDLACEMVSGIRYDSAYIGKWWEEMDTATQDQHLSYMEDAWTAPVATN